MACCNRGPDSDPDLDLITALALCEADIDMHLCPERLHVAKTLDMGWSVIHLEINEYLI